MKPFYLILFLILAACSIPTIQGARPSSTVILDETGVKNLRIETQIVEETTFEESIFALGEISVYPGRRAV